MADTALAPFSERDSAEAQVTSNLFAFFLWERALYPADPLLHGAAAGAGFAAWRRAADARPAAAAARLAAFTGRSDVAPRLLAGLVLDADLRPDDRLWIEGTTPGWAEIALTVSAGRASSLDEASVWIGATPPMARPPRLRRLVLTGLYEDIADHGRGLTFAFAAAWR